MPPVVSVSVDLDEVACYFAIHALGPCEPGVERLVYERAVPRLAALFDRLGVPATFFVIGESLDPDLGAPAARDLAARGHEIANHTFTHPYDFLALDLQGRRDEVVRCAEAIEKATGVRPVGFRAPGYNVDTAALGLLESLGYAYDSSVFPCPPYYLVKAVALARVRLRGERSRAIMGPPEVMLAPAEPYRAGSAFWRGGRGIAELPVAVLPLLRLPFIGTTLTLGGPNTARLMARAVARRRFVGLELHGIDLLDERDGLGRLARFQPDVRVPLARKVEALEAAIGELRRGGAQLLTSEQAARRLCSARS